MTNVLGKLHLSYEGVKRRKIRSILTILAITIGIAAVVSLILIGNSLEVFINKEAENLGTHTILISPGGSNDMTFGMLSTVKLTDDDLKTIENVNGVESAAGAAFKLARQEYNDKVTYNWIISFEPDVMSDIFEKGLGISAEKGRYFRETNNEVVVGYLYANDPNNIFGKIVSIGDKLIIEGEEFKVVGSMERIGNPNDDSQIYINLDNFNRIFKTETHYGFIYVFGDESYNIDSLVKSINEKLRKERGLEKGEEDFSIQTANQLFESFTTIFSVVSVVLTGLASISLVVGAVGIANTMFTAVLERTREIGTLKAIGATDFDVMLSFMIESGFFGFIGGILGISLGYIISFTVSYIADVYLAIPLETHIIIVPIIAMVIFSLIFGALSGYFPARRAAKMNVSEALRYE